MCVNVNNILKNRLSTRKQILLCFRNYYTLLFNKLYCVGVGKVSKSKVIGFCVE